VPSPAEGLDPVVAAVADHDEPLLGEPDAMHRVVELLRRRRMRIVGQFVVSRRLAVCAPHSLEGAGPGVEDDDAVIV